MGGLESSVLTSPVLGAWGGGELHKVCVGGRGHLRDLHLLALQCQGSAPPHRPHRLQIWTEQLLGWHL